MLVVEQTLEGLIMFENILSGEVDNFKSLEQNIFKFVCELGKNIIRNILENEDDRLLSLSDKKIFVNKGFKSTTIKTIIGEITFKRRIYRIYDEDSNDTGKYVFLLDQKLQIFESGLFSQNMTDLMVNAMLNTGAYRKAAEEISTSTNQSASHETIRKAIIVSGEKLAKKEDMLIELNEQEKIELENKEIPVLFEESDGKWINLQGKDRQKRIEQYKKKAEKERKDFKKPKSVKSEIKMHMMHEGWKLNDNRHPLVNKTYIVGFIPINKLKRIRKAKIKQRYNENKIQLKVNNGDGAKWIKKLMDKGEIYQKDMLHIQKYITKNVPKEYRQGIQELITNKMYEYIYSYLEWVKSDSGGEEIIVKKLQQTQQYLADGLPRYTDQIQKLPALNEGLEYRTMGNAESNIFTVFTKLFTGRKSFSIKGATYLAKVAALKIETKSTVITEHINAPIKIDNSVEEYINEIEKTVARLNSVKPTRKSIYEYKNSEIPSSLHFLKELARIKPISELSYM